MRNPFPNGAFPLTERAEVVREPQECPECHAVRGFVSIIHKVTCSRVTMTKADVERVLGGAG